MFRENTVIYITGSLSSFNECLTRSASLLICSEEAVSVLSSCKHGSSPSALHDEPRSSQFSLVESRSYEVTAKVFTKSSFQLIFLKFGTRLSEGHLLNFISKAVT